MENELKWYFEFLIFTLFLYLIVACYIIKFPREVSSSTAKLFSWNENQILTNQQRKHANVENLLVELW